MMKSFGLGGVIPNFASTLRAVSAPLSKDAAHTKLKPRSAVAFAGKYSNRSLISGFGITTDDIFWVSNSFGK